MGIEKVRNNFEGNLSSKFSTSSPIKNRVMLGTAQDSTSFTGAEEVAATAIKPIKETILEIMPKIAKRMVKAYESMGEIQNQFINALGTGLVAPLFIKFNPISDTDQDTRTYTAWRQPVSAVLTVCTQCAIVKPFNDLIAWMSDIGYLGQKFNASLFQSDKFLKKQIKADNPDKTFTKEEMKTALKQYKANQSNTLKNMIINDKIELLKTDRHGSTKFEMPEEDFKKLFSETVGTIINAERKERAKAIDEKLPLQIERNVFYHDHPVASRRVLERVASKIGQVYSEASFSEDQVLSAHNAINNEFKQIIKELKSEIKKNPAKKSTNTELIKIVTELKNKNTNKDASAIRLLQNKIHRMITNVNVMASKKTTQEIIETVSKGIFDRTNAIDEIISLLSGIKNKVENSGMKVQDAQNIINERIKSSKESTLAMLQARGLSEKEIQESYEVKCSLASRLEQKAGSLASCIADQLKKHVKSNIDGYKRWTGLGVSLAILPVTCWMLNRIYPWFMDLAFPKLSNKKGKPATANNTQNSKVEVK